MIPTYFGLNSIKFSKNAQYEYTPNSTMSSNTQLYAPSLKYFGRTFTKAIGKWPTEVQYLQAKDEKATYTIFKQISFFIE